MALRIGVCGMGESGALRARLAQQVGGAVLLAIVDADAAVCAQRQEEFPGVPVYTSIFDALAHSSADAWVVCVGQRGTARVCKELLAAGKAVLCTKQLSEDLDEAEALAPYVDTGAHGRGQGQLMVSAVGHYEPEFRALRRHDAGARAVTFVHCERYTAIGRLGSEPLWANIAHCLMQLRVLTGGHEPTDLRAMSHKRRAEGAAAAAAPAAPPGGAEETLRGKLRSAEEHLCTAQLAWSDGAVATLVAGAVLPGSAAAERNRLQVFGDSWCATVRDPRVAIEEVR
jgi:predicted dehydrogenase